MTLQYAFRVLSRRFKTSDLRFVFPSVDGDLYDSGPIRLETCGEDLSEFIDGTKLQPTSSKGLGYRGESNP